MRKKKKGTSRNTVPRAHGKRTPNHKLDPHHSQTRSIVYMSRVLSKALPQGIKTESVKKNNCLFGFEGGERLKFGDVVTATASLSIIDMLLDFALLVVFVPLNSYWGVDVAGIIALLIASLIVGYVFAAKIHEESKIRTIGRIVVIFTLVFMFATLAMFANPYANTALTETLESMYSTSGWTTWDWVAYSQLAMLMLVALNVVFALVFSFIGLYAGSMLRKSRKSQT